MISATAAVAVIAAVVVSNVLTRSTPPAAGPPPTGVETFAETARAHVETPVTYDRTPPAGGDHSPMWLNCGIYDQPVPNESAVHSLEHGAVWIAYQSSLSNQDVQSLRTLVASKYAGAQRYVVLSPYPGLPSPVVATAWGNQMRVQTVADPQLGQFIDHFREGPQDLEPGAACTGGLGAPIG